MERWKGYPRLRVCSSVGAASALLYTHFHTLTHTSKSTFVHRCGHHKCVKWGCYCHIAGRLAAPVLITLSLLRLQALLFYLRELWQPEVCKLSAASNFRSSQFHSWEPQLALQARVQDNKASVQEDELTNRQVGRRVCVKGQETLWRAGNRKLCLYLHTAFCHISTLYTYSTARYFCLWDKTVLCSLTESSSVIMLGVWQWWVEGTKEGRGEYLSNMF